MFRQTYLAIILSMSCTFAAAQSAVQKMGEVDAMRQQGVSVGFIIPIFSQLLHFSFPRGFVPVFEDAKGGQYIQESVIAGESNAKWTQKITVLGLKGLAARPNLTPQLFADALASTFQRVCPSSYSTRRLGDIKLENHEATATVISCGIANGEPYSESALVVVIKGANDYYNIQWAERGEASKTPISLEHNKWADRLKSLGPIKVCPIVPGESAPYPSCLNRP